MFSPSLVKPVVVKASAKPGPQSKGREKNFCLGVFVPFENFSLIWRRHHYRWTAANLELYSALMVIKQWFFLACHTFCDTEHPLIMVISEDPWHWHLLPSVTSCFIDLGLSRLGFKHPTFRMRNKTICAHWYWHWLKKTISVKLCNFIFQTNPKFVWRQNITNYPIIHPIKYKKEILMW